MMPVLDWTMPPVERPPRTSASCSRLAADLRSKEFEASVDADGLAERCRLAAIEQEINAPAAKPE